MGSEDQEHTEKGEADARVSTPDGHGAPGGGDRVSRTSDGGDGMGEGGSVIGACHYAR